MDEPRQALAGLGAARHRRPGRDGGSRAIPGGGENTRYDLAGTGAEDTLPRIIAVRAPLGPAFAQSPDWGVHGGFRNAVAEARNMKGEGGGAPLVARHFPDRNAPSQLAREPDRVEAKDKL